LSSKQFLRLLNDYKSSLQGVKSEATRADRFRDFIREAFPKIEVGSLKGFYPELEKYLKTMGAGQVVKGRADSLFGNLVIEFEGTLDASHESEAKEQLCRYVFAIWSNQADLGQTRGKLTAIATDGISLVVLKPRSLVPHGPVSLDQVILEEVDRADISQLNPEEVHTWLGRYIVTAANELRTVDPDEFARVFGVGSKIFSDVLKVLEKGWSKAKGDSSALYEQWESHLRIVYGSAVGGEDLYLRHTYLATLAKFVVYAAYSGGALPISREELVRILNGSIFKEWRIVNFIEEDLFSWVHKTDEGLRGASLLSSGLASYDLTTVTLDVFKEIYQGLVDPEDRHDLGEYYTPDWLAEMIVGDVLSDNAYQSVLDPACGSGTFLAATIALKRQHIRDLKPNELVGHILQNVVGVDVHPLAVMVSRATYLTSVGRELLDYREGDLVVPVYMSDSIRIPAATISIHGGVKVYPFIADGLRLDLPMEVAEDPVLADAVVDALRDYSIQAAPGAKDDPDYFRSYLTARVQGLEKLESDVVFQALNRTASNMVDLIEKNRDTVWGFILKNYYKPIFLKKRKFDAIVGNPPWLSYRYVRSTEYQKFLKDLIIDTYGLLPSDKVELMTHMELATLFLLRCADLYLKEDGVISYVMPRSIMVSDQHHSLRIGSLSFKLAIIRLIDLEGVAPLFNVPSCVVFCKRGTNTVYPVEGRVLSGRLPKKNMEYHKAMDLMEKNVRTEFELGRVGDRSYLAQVGAGPPRRAIAAGRSPYFGSFRQGATTVPRSVWFVDVEAHPKLGLDPRMPFVRTSARATKGAKEVYRDVKLQGNVESEFLYAVMSGSELVPFGSLEPLVAVLPIEPQSQGQEYGIVRRSDAKRRRLDGLENWLEHVETVWRRKRGEKAQKATIYDWLDYQGKLTAQNPSKKFKILYNTSGTYLVSCVASNSPRTIRVDGVGVQLHGLIADWKTFWFETDNKDEAHYLSAILNSPRLDEAIKPMQSRGAFGARDIVKKPLEFPIPLYDPGNPTHRKLSELSMQCHGKVATLLPALAQRYDSIGKIRSEIKKELRDEIEQINRLTKQVLG
jgi:hypothetical protein